MCISPRSDLWLGYRIQPSPPLIKTVLQSVGSLGFLFVFVFQFLFTNKVTSGPVIGCKGVFGECSHGSEWRVRMHC